MMLCGMRAELDGSAVRTLHHHDVGDEVAISIDVEAIKK
jgi:hypothetical protein